MSAQITCFCSGYNENCFACFGSGYRNTRRVSPGPKRRRRGRTAGSINVPRNQQQENCVSTPIRALSPKCDQSVAMTYTVLKKVKEGDHYVYRLS